MIREPPLKTLKNSKRKMDPSIYSMLGPCGAGLRKDCIKKVCLARHTDDPLPNLVNKKSLNMTGLKKKYSTRSTGNTYKEDDPQNNTLEGCSFNVPCIEMSQDGKVVNEKSPSSSMMHSNYFEMKRKFLDLNGVYGNRQVYIATGLNNYGNWCYMNATLQCLIRSEEFVDLLFPKKEYEPLTYPAKTMTEELRFLTTVVKSGEYKSVTPADMKKCVDKIIPKFAGTRQQDAHEFLTCMLDQMKREITNKSPQLKINYEGLYESVVTCDQCNKSSQPKIEPYSSIHVDIIPEKINPKIEDGIKKLVEGDKLEEYRCDSCCNKGPAIKKISLMELPKMLIVQIKRFKFDDYGFSTKDYTFVDFPLLLTVEDNKKASHNYELTSLVNHTGTTSGGHYTACCKDIVREEWYHCNDSRVEIIDCLDRRMKRNAYILIYKKVTSIRETKDSVDDRQEMLEQEIKVSEEINQIRRSNRDPKPSKKMMDLTATTNKTGKIDEPRNSQNKSKAKEEAQKNSETLKSKAKDTNVGSFCACNKPNDDQAYTKCNHCHKQFFLESASLMCEECSNHRTEQLKTAVKNLQDEAKNKDSSQQKSQSTAKSLERELDKLRKENNKLKSEMEKKETKYKKDLDVAAEKLNNEKLRNSKNVEEKEKSHSEEVMNLKKELENKKKEIDIHVKKIVEITDRNYNSNHEPTELPDERPEQQTEEQQKDRFLDPSEITARGESSGTIEELRMKLEDSEKKRKEDQEKWRGEKHVMEVKHKQEVDKLKADINGYEARLESVLEDASRKEKMVDTLLDESRTIRAINKSLEMQGGGMITNDETEKENGEDKEKAQSDSCGEIKETKKRICWNWSRNQKCRFGENCWFLHSRNNKEKKMNYSEQLDHGKSVRTDYEKYSVVENEDSNKKGRQHRGETRPGDNTDKKESLWSKKETKERRRERLCWYIEQDKKCPFGSECWFSHNKTNFTHYRPDRRLPAQEEASQEMKRSGIHIKEKQIICDNGQLSKNDRTGMQQMMHLHSVYSLVNQVKQQSMDIMELKKILTKRR